MNKAVKQSLTEWTIENEDNKTIGWIKKEKDGLGYMLEYKFCSEVIKDFYPTFKEAKTAAKEID